MTASTDDTRDPQRTHALSVALCVFAITAGLALAPAPNAGAAEPLPAGAYRVEVGMSAIELEVDERGVPRVTSPDDLVVRLQFDADGRVLDELEVGAPTGSFLARVSHDGTRLVELDSTILDGEAVSIVADCPVNGLVAEAVGMPNHGTVMSHAASGMRMTTMLSDPITGDVVRLDADFTDAAGARAYCARVDELVPSVEEIRALIAVRRAAARGDLDAARAAQEAEAAAEAARGTDG